MAVEAYQRTLGFNLKQHVLGLEFPQNIRIRQCDARVAFLFADF